MPQIIKILVLAVIQGITEFLPISSSGHLGMAKHCLGLESPGASVEIALHAGTLVAVIVFFRRKLADLTSLLFRGQSDAWTYAGKVALGTIPIAVTGVTMKSHIEDALSSPAVIAIMWLIMAFALLSLKFCRREQRPISWISSIVVGIAQALALIPGISRAGATIIAARHMKVTARDAAEFSFMLFIPAVTGAMILGLVDILDTGLGAISPLGLCAGIVVSALVGYAALTILMKTLTSEKMWYFGLYCLMAGIIGLIVAY